MPDDGARRERRMMSFDRDATIERKQIHEISLNVARRLRHVLDRNQYIPAALRPEVDQTVRVITGIQRDIDQIMGALPASEALDFAILTHIMGGQRHALDLLEILEEKLAGGRNTYQRDSTRVHQALIAVSREIEEDARRYANESTAEPYPSPGWHSVSQRQAPGPSSASPRTKASPGKSRNTQRAGITAVRALLTKPAPIALAALALGAGLVMAVQKLAPPESGAPTAAETAGLAPGPAREVDAPATTPRPAETAAVITPNVEQPYLVVLATRRSTEELQQDYRSFKGSYPELLGDAKARVDRVQGQDKQTWYRLSLIPPQSYKDAKTLCSSLRKAGLSGCWIKPVPLH